MYGDQHSPWMARTACMVHAGTQHAMHVLQEADVATIMCEDMALLGSTHLIKHSRWNKHLGAQVCLCRISQVSCSFQMILLSQMQLSSCSDSCFSARNSMQHTHGQQLRVYTGTMSLTSSQQLCCWPDGNHMLTPDTLCNVV